MFTGLVQTLGLVKGVKKTANGAVLTVDVNNLADEVKIGDSVAVNGVCLTACRLNFALVDFEVSPESLRISTLSKLRAGNKVNLELAMSANGRFGGHIVQGHVDGLAVLKSVDKKGGFYDVTFTADKNLMSMMVPKGSVAVNGISLTIAKMDKQTFTIAVIPVTWNETNLAMLAAGDEVNIETDVIVKAVRKQLENMLSTDSGNNLTIEKLRSLGF